MSFLNCYETFHYFEKMFFIKSEPYTRALYKLPQEEKVIREVTIENSITSFWAISFSIYGSVF